MNSLRPFTKIIDITTADIDVSFTDTAGSSVSCNYIKVGMLGNPTSFSDFVDVEISGISSIGAYRELSMVPDASGVFMIGADSKRPGIVFLPESFATGVRIHRRFGTASRQLYITYGVLTTNVNKLKSYSRFIGK